MLKCLIRWAMKEQIRQFKEEVAMNAIKELGLEDEYAYEVHKANEQEDRELNRKTET